MKVCKLMMAAMIAAMAVGVRGKAATMPAATQPASPALRPPTVTIQISGRAIEKPVLEYALLYKPEEMRKGNAAVKYLVAAQGLNDYPKLKQEDMDALDKFRTEPLADLDDNAVMKYTVMTSVEKLGGPFRWMREGSRLESYDIETETREQGFRALIPSLSKYRQLANLLAIGIRLDIKHHRWAEAREKLAIGYGMARHVAHGDTVIENLVGAAIATVMTKCLEDWVIEGGPNLYWDLVNMPRPFTDMRRALSFERATAIFSFPEMKEMKEGKFYPGQWAAFMRRFGAFAHLNGEGLPESFDLLNSDIGAAAFGAMLYPQAKEFLVARGLKKQDIERMAVEEVLGRYFIRSYDEEADEMFKGFGLPVYEGAKIGDKAEKEFLKQSGNVNILARILVPSLGRAGILAARADRDLDMVRVVEGIRAYAAQQGRLPEKLEEVGLPMPLDVTTGKPFEYTRHGNEAYIVSPSPYKNWRHGAVIEIKLKGK